MFRNYSLIIIFSFITTLVLSQELKYTEVKDKNIPYNGSAEKALLIFQTDLNLSFEASNDLLESIIKEDGKYKVPISAGSQLLTIISDCCGRIRLNFVYDDLGTLNPKIVRYFTIGKSNILGIDDRTKFEAPDFAAYNEKDGYLIFMTSAIPNIDLEFKEKNGYVTKVMKEPGRYRLYTKSGVPINLQIIAKGYDEMHYSIDTLSIKAVKYFRLYSLSKFEENKTSDLTLKKGSYKILTSPVGALVEIDGNPFFNKQTDSERKTPLELNGISAGALKINIELNKYEKVSDTIIIGGTQNVSEYKLIPTVSHIRFNIYPNNATVFVDGSEQTALEFDTSEG